MKNKLGSVALSSDIAAPACFHCPITHAIMKDPVIDPQGNTYDRPAIEEWLREHARTSPTSRRALTVQQLVPNRALREAIAEHMGACVCTSERSMLMRFVGSLLHCSFVSLRKLGTYFTHLGPGWVAEEDPKHCALIRSGMETIKKDEQDITKPTSRAIVDGFLAELSASIGKNMRLNESGVCAFTYEILTIVIEAPLQVATFFVYTTLRDGGNSVVPPPPEEEGGFPRNHHRLLELAMEKNYLQQETRGGCLGTDPRTGDLLYSFSERAHEISAADFRNILENFIDAAVQFYADFNGKSAVVEKAGPKTV